MSFSIATWNVNSLKVRLPQVVQWLQTAQPSVLALQETKLIDENFPSNVFHELGYQTLFAGQKTYNGVAILSKGAGNEVVTEFPAFPDPARRVLATTWENKRIINLYVPNGAAVGSDKYQYKLAWLKGLTQFLEEQIKKYSDIVILGDFNIAPADEDVHDPVMWEGQVLVSPAERAALKSILALGFHDSFRLFKQLPQSFSWWDYRAGAFRRNHGLRIDHILLSQALSSRCQSCIIDKTPRGSEQPSDHAPVLATFA